MFRSEIRHLHKRACKYFTAEEIGLRAETARFWDVAFPDYFSHPKLNVFGRLRNRGVVRRRRAE